MKLFNTYPRIDICMERKKITINFFLLVGWLCLTSHRQRGHLETAPPFTVPCEGREARYKNYAFCLQILCTSFFGEIR